MSLARKIFSNTAWQVLGKIITAILGIVSIKYITNYLSREMYGEYTIIYDLTANFAIIADFGLFTIAVREMARDSRKEMVQKIVCNVLSIRALLGLGALGLGAVAMWFIPVYRGSFIPPGVAIVAIATFITLIAGTISSVLQFYLRMQWASLALIVGKIITVAYILVVILYLFPKNPAAGFFHLQFGWIIGGILTLIITFIAAKKIIAIGFEWDFSFWKTTFVKALPYGVALILGTLYFRMGTIVLSLFGMKEQAGYYGVPLRFLEILQIIPHYLMNSVLPILTISLLENKERAERITKYALSALTSLAFPVLVGGWLLAWPIIAAVSDEKFLSYRLADGALVAGSDVGLKILLVAMTLTYFHVALNYALVAMGRQIQILWANAAALAVNVIFNLILAPRFGFIGASIASVITEATILSILFFLVRREMKRIWDFRFITKTVVASVFMGVVLFLTRDYFNTFLFAKSLAVLIPLGGIIFIGTMMATKALSPEMIALLRRAKPEPDEP